ncbi:SGNH/GDSL hydrolase family protein [Patulibacter sp. NPDC049589]|uniref:SGNH/GDSL hydrolase family protein n=1 Tax=Patulibacter sp. NPDC049589 TaxID=3154731 RepID=UPI003421ED68
MSAIVGVAAAAPVAGASERYVSLGDSYTAAPLVPGLITDPPLSCARSDHNYPRLVAIAVSASYFRDASCSGALTKDMTEAQTPSLLDENVDGAVLKLLFGPNPPQFDALRRDTTLVTVGIGGNDAGLVSAGYQCIALGLLQPLGSPCKDANLVGGVDRLTARIDAAAPKMAAVFRGIHARSPNARVLAVGYPAVVPADGRTCWPLPLPFSAGDVPYFADMLQRINRMIATQAAANDVEFVDTFRATTGNDVCRGDAQAGFTVIVPTNGLSLFAHPNELGEQRMASAVIEQLGRARPTTPTPASPAPAPARVRISGLRLTPTRATVHVSAPARVRIAVARRDGSAWRTVRRRTVTFAGARTRRVRIARLAAGRYRVTVSATPRTGPRASRRVVARIPARAR